MNDAVGTCIQSLARHRLTQPVICSTPGRRQPQLSHCTYTPGKSQTRHSPLTFPLVKSPHFVSGFIEATEFLAAVQLLPPSFLDLNAGLTTMSEGRPSVPEGIGQKPQFQDLKLELKSHKAAEFSTDDNIFDIKLKSPNAVKMTFKITQVR